MSLDPANFVSLLRDIVDLDPHRRSLGGDAVTDVRTELDAGQQRCLAAILAELALGEVDGVAREAQLHALAELHEWDGVSPDTLQKIQLIDTSTLSVSEGEYVEFLAG